MEEQRGRQCDWEQTRKEEKTNREREGGRSTGAPDHIPNGSLIAEDNPTLTNFHRYPSPPSGSRLWPLQCCVFLAGPRYALSQSHLLLLVTRVNACQGYSVRESIPSKLPEKPPYTAHLGNLSYDATSESVTDFFTGCDVVSVRIIEDREMQRPKGFGYVEFGNLEGLKKALTLDGQSFEGRMIKIKIADPRMSGPYTLQLAPRTPYAN